MTDDIVGPPSYQSEERKKKGLTPEQTAIFDSYREQREKEYDEAQAELQKNRRRLSNLIKIVEDMMRDLDPEFRIQYVEKLRGITK